VKRGEHGRRIASVLPFGELADQPPAWGPGFKTAIVFWRAVAEQELPVPISKPMRALPTTFWKWKPPGPRLRWWARRITYRRRPTWRRFLVTKAP